MDNQRGETRKSRSAVGVASELGKLRTSFEASQLQFAAFKDIKSLGEALQASSARRSVFGATSIDIQGSLPAWQGSAGYDASLGTLSATTKALDAIGRDSATYKTAFGTLSATRALSTASYDTARYGASLGTLSATTKALDAIGRDSATYKTAFATLNASKALDAIGRDSAAYKIAFGALSATEALGTIWRDATAYKATHPASIHSFQVDVEDLLGDEHVNTLIENDWCVPMHASDRQVISIAELFETDPDAATECMCELVRNQIDSIEAEVVQQFPHRAAILRETFTAHRQQMFNLSVPVFLTQTDGFWHERCGHNLFGDNIRDTIAATQGGRVKGGIIECLLQSLTNPRWKLRQSRKKRTAEFANLNRHQVLHGEVIDYGTEENSLKAIALLHFSSVILLSPDPSPAPCSDARDAQPAAA